MAAPEPNASPEGPDPAEQAWQIYVTGLTNAWIRRIFGRTALSEIEEIPLNWLVSEGPSLVDELVRTAWSAEAGSSGLERTPRVSRPVLESVSRFAEERGESHHDAPGNDLLALQSLLTETLSREAEDGRPDDATARIARLATLFGQLQDQVRTVTRRSPGALADLLTGEHGGDYLQEWLGNMIAEYERYGKGFALLLISIDGLDYLVNAHGHHAATSMVEAVREIIAGQLRTTDRLFRRGSDQFCILAPNQEIDSIRVLAERLCTVIDSVQSDDHPRVGIAAGIASCPMHGTDPDTLLAAADAAIWQARSNGNIAALRPI